METPEVPRERRALPRTITPLTLPAASGVGILRFPLKPQPTQDLVRSALQEDAAFNDLTTIATVVSNRRSRATLVARQSGVVCGLPLALEAFRLLDAKATFRIEHEDGVRVKAGEPVLFVTGHARGLLSAERVALNYMQRLSGIATLTWRYVDAVRAICREYARSDAEQLAVKLTKTLHEVTDEFLRHENRDRPEVLEQLKSPSIVPE